MGTRAVGVVTSRLPPGGRPGEDISYTYDADGNLAKRTKTAPTPAQTTVYAGGIFEKNTTTGEITKYYYAGGQRVAMRKNGTVYFLTQDHLGGTSLVTQAGDPPKLVSRVRYYPYGLIRTQEGTLPTDKLYTGQQRETTAIYNYGARFYNADIGRFLSADSIVPGAGDLQALNRYSYVYNNPIKYNDPMGQRPADDPCWHNGKSDCSGIPSGPVAQALEIVPIAPHSIDRIIQGCEFCAYHNRWLMERTWWAVETLHDAGLQLHMLPWGDRRYVAELVQGLYGQEALAPWYDAPAQSEMKEYMLAGFAIASVGAGGSGGGSPGGSGSIVPNTQIGSFWNQFKADFGSGNLQNYRIQTPTLQNSEYSTAHNNAVSTRGITITNLRTNQAVNVHIVWRLNFTPQGVPYLVALHMHPVKQ